MVFQIYILELKINNNFQILYEFINSVAITVFKILAVKNGTINQNDNCFIYEKVL